MISNQLYSFTELDSLLTIYTTQRKDTSKIKTGIKISNFYQKEKHYSKADDYLQEALILANELPYVEFKHKVNKSLAYNEHHRHDYESSIGYCRKAEQYAVQMSHTVFIAEIRNLMAGNFVFLGEYDDGLKILEDLIVFTKKNELHTNLALALTASAGVAYNRGDFKKTADLLYETAETYRILEDTAKLASTYRNLSLIYGQIKNYDLAKKFIRKSLVIGEKLGDYSRIVDAYARFGTVYENEKKIDSALYYLNLAEEICEPGKEDELVEVYGNLGNIYRDLEEYDKATEYFEKTMQIVVKTRDKRMMSILFYNIGEMKVKQGKYKEALSNFQELLEYANESKELEILEKANYGVYQVHYALGNYKDALDSYITYRKYGDTLRDSETMSQLNNLEAQKQKELDEEIHQLELQRQVDILEKEKEQKVLIIVASVVGALFLLTFLFILNRRYRVTTKQKEIIENQRAELQVKSTEMIDSINYAKRIQDSYLPNELTFRHLFENGFVLFQPKDIVSGDFYWFFSKKDDHTGVFSERFLAAADCTGHGVPGALMSLICANSLNEVVVRNGIDETGHILDHTRNLVQRTLKSNGEKSNDGMDISFAKFYSSGGNHFVQWSGANNPLWIVRKNNDTSEYELIELKGDKQPIGYYFNEKPFASHTIELSNGDTVYLFSDGFQDQFGGDKGKKFKVNQLKKEVLEMQDLPMQEQKNRLERTFVEWKGSFEQTDDVCFIGVRID
jgi:serine phosphatase RsbU (regulator of sigma subunit)